MPVQNLWVVVCLRSQVQDGEERVICYHSRTFTKAERNYCVTRRELLAIIDSVKHFHHYIYGSKCVVRTDHGSLAWLVRFANPEAQLARWLETLSMYEITTVRDVCILMRML